MNALNDKMELLKLIKTYFVHEADLFLHVYH